MRFICAQPATDYYTWQVEVMIHSFMEQGVNPNDIEIVCSYKDTVPEVWRRLAGHYNYVRFFFYQDTRINPGYISSVRPHILHKHWLAHPELATMDVFYHDCDIALTQKADFSELLQDDICYVSDTVSYIGANYIQSKGDYYLDIMTEIVGVDKSKVIAEEANSGGAQYLLKKIGAEFWVKVYNDCEKLYTTITPMQGGNHSDPLQIWCADMWAVLWNLWYFQREVRVTPKMSFSWATSPIKEWDEHPIFHNAGVTSEGDFFFKALHTNSTPYQQIAPKSYNELYCSYNYAHLVSRTGVKSILI